MTNSSTLAFPFSCIVHDAVHRELYIAPALLRGVHQASGKLTLVPCGCRAALLPLLRDALRAEEEGRMRDACNHVTIVGEQAPLY